MIKRLSLYALLLVLLLGGLWYLFFALKPSPMAESDILRHYALKRSDAPDITLNRVSERQYDFVFTNAEGQQVNGRISYPDSQQARYPVMLGVPAMGRSYLRWWQDSFKGNPTLTHINDIGEMANNAGYVLVSIDARYNGQRKRPDMSLRKILFDMHMWGDTTAYEDMIVGTTRDWQEVLLWLRQQENIDPQNITVAGYSMGAQIALMLCAVDKDIRHTLAIVPPYLDDKIAVTAPKNLVHRIANDSVLLMTANDDEYATAAQNDLLVGAFRHSNIQHITFDSGHLLPETYLQDVQTWLTSLPAADQKAELATRF